MPHTPVSYLQELLCMRNLRVNGVRETSHWRPPMMRRSVLRISYKTTCMESFTQCFSVAGTTIKTSAHFSEEREVPIESKTDVVQTAEDVIRLAMRKEESISCSCELKIDPGQKPSRELELIWWPNIYEHSDYGKLSLRFYVGRVQR